MDTLSSATAKSGNMSNLVSHLQRKPSFFYAPTFFPTKAKATGHHQVSVKDSFTQG